jgi:phosphoribosylaminoimidazole-succinocarboxamide synthase
VSDRYIELYEQIVGERFERETSDEDIAQRIENNVKSWLNAFKSK